MGVSIESILLSSSMMLISTRIVFEINSHVGVYLPLFNGVLKVNTPITFTKAETGSTKTQQNFTVAQASWQIFPWTNKFKTQYIKNLQTLAISRLQIEIALCMAAYSRQKNQSANKQRYVTPRQILSLSRVPGHYWPPLCNYFLINVCRCMARRFA